MGTAYSTGPVALQCPQCGGGLRPSTEGFTICPYCGSSLVWPGGQAEAEEAGAAAVHGLRLRRFTYTDTECTGLELFRMLVPVGWAFEGGCRWTLDNPGMPAAVAFRVRNPDGAETFEVLPNMNLKWTRGSFPGRIQPIGARHFGAEIREPMGIGQAMRSLVLPRYRPWAEHLEILVEEALPDLPKLVRSEAPLSGGWAEGGKVRVRYTWQGYSFEEEIYGVVEVFRAPVQGLFSVSEVLIWFVDYLFAFRAAAGRLDNTADLFGVMIGSFQLNPEWYAAYKSIVQILAQQQIQHIRTIGQLGDLYAQAGREMREQNLRDWYARQEVYDRLATDWSRTIRSVDAFYDPHRQEVVELPSGYGHAWANNLGEYIVTESPSFDPNVYSNLHWEPMGQQ
jgi:hypothetical protein